MLRLQHEIHDAVAVARPDLKVREEWKELGASAPRRRHCQSCQPNIAAWDQLVKSSLKRSFISFIIESIHNIVIYNIVI